MKGQRWLEVTAIVAAEAAEAVGEKLLRMGARGFATEERGAARALIAYFPGDDEGPPGDEPPAGDEAEQAPSAASTGRDAVLARQARELREFLGRLPGWGLDSGPAEVTARLVDAEDWRDQWKAYFHPTRVGRRLLVHPPWEQPAEVRPGDLAVVIEPGEAFGTGTHPTTRGALELVEMAGGKISGRRTAPGASTPTLPTPAQDLPTLALDLGTGSGILAIAAAKLGFDRVLAVDCDPAAVETAAENVARNGVSGRVEVVEGDAFAVLAGPERAGQRPILVMANLTTDLVAALARPVVDVLGEGGLFVGAGVSAGEGEERVAEAARRAGLEELERRTGEGWTAFLFRRAAHRSTGESPERTARRPAGRVARPRAVFCTLGCKANLYDTAGMMNDLKRAGWEVTSAAEERRRPGEPGADLYVVNSCAVTARAESKSRQLARRLKRENPGALVALVGCFPQLRRQAAAGEGVDLVLGTADRGRLVEVLAEARGERGEPSAPAIARAVDQEREVAVLLETVPGAFAGERTRAAVKVQDGCEQFCTYCVIPYARGPSRSRPLGEVLEEVERLVRGGFREVVVTGIHLGAWGLDLRDPGRLADLVRAIAGVPGLARVRLSSIEPLEITDELVDLLATNPRVCRHLHVPLQSGSDEVLARMNRHYTAVEFLAMVDRVRSRVPLAGLTTDVMVGFPGETDADFEATLAVVERARFSRLHVFRFSRRPGTPAADMPGQVDPAVRKARSEALIGLGRRLAREFREGLVGRTMEVLVERASGEGREGLAWPSGEGFTDNYVRVTFRGPHARPNEIVPVLLEKVTAEGLAGREGGPPERPIAYSPESGRAPSAGSGSGAFSR